MRDRLAANLARLAARPYGEVGVPMFLLAERIGAPSPAGDGEPALAAALAAMAAASDASAAPLVEVLADRHLLGEGGPCFTRLSEGEAP